MIATRTYKRSYEIGKEEFNVKASKKKQAKLDRRRRQYDYMKSEKNGFKRPGSRKK